MTQDAFNQTEALMRARMEIAGHRAEIAELRGDITELKMSLAKQAQLLQEVLATLSEARGGWKTLMMLGGLSAAFGGVIAWVVEHFMKRGG